MFRMYDSKRYDVELICENSVMDTIIDKFGINATTYAYAQKQEYMDKNHAIVMGKSQVFSTPAESGTALFTLHEGTKVETRQ